MSYSQSSDVSYEENLTLESFTSRRETLRERIERERDERYQRNVIIIEDVFNYGTNYGLPLISQMKIKGFVDYVSLDRPGGPSELSKLWDEKKVKIFLDKHGRKLNEIINFDDPLYMINMSKRGQDTIKYNHFMIEPMSVKFGYDSRGFKYQGPEEAWQAEKSYGIDKGFRDLDLIQAIEYISNNDGDIEEVGVIYPIIEDDEIDYVKKETETALNSEGEFISRGTPNYVYINYRV